ncbi:MAG: hypothetical protein EOO65_06040, partial [Methanosarcinales archaeon]
MVRANESASPIVTRVRITTLALVCACGSMCDVGTGSRSIYGTKFEDEFHESLRHDKPGVLSMANSGRNTNGSQFFILFEKAPAYDDKHTVFGHLVRGWKTLAQLSAITCAVGTKDKPAQRVQVAFLSPWQREQLLRHGGDGDR